MTTLTTKGQVTIPKAVRSRLGLKPGDDIVFEFDRHGHVILHPVTIGRGEHPFASVRGTIKGRFTTDQLMALTRGEDVN